MASSPVPVTLNCSGGIALGAYMAGVFTELVKAALRPRHGQAAEAIRIDTITGASAGAMTGLIAARSLLQDPDRSLADLADDGVGGSGAEPRNGFFRAWVRLADIQALLDDRAEEEELRKPASTGTPPRPRLGLLSGASIATIAETVAGDWSVGDLPGLRRALQQRSLALLMTATNLQGVLRASASGPLSVSHAETRRFLFHRAMEGLNGGDPSDLSRRWRKAKDSARASGAFPVAFPPLSNDSSPRSINLALDATSEGLYTEEARALAEDDPAGDPDRVCWMEDANGQPDPAGPHLRLRFDYTDGGVLDGLPILKGIGLLNQLAAPEQGEPDDELRAFAAEWFHTPPVEERRRFVYVQPIPVTDLRSSPSLLRRFFGALASGLAGLTYPKAEHDHLRLQQIEEINRLVERREALIDQVGRSSPEAERLRQALPFRPVNLDPIDPVLTFRSEAFRALLLQETEREMGQPPAGAPASEAEALLRFETLLGQRTGAQPKPSGRLAPADLLASDFLGAFGGFFDERYRRHDYLIGRLSGLAWLRQEGPRGEPPLLTDDDIRAEVRELVRRARRDYLPQTERSGLRFPADWLRLLRLLAVRLPYVLLSDVLAAAGDGYRPLAAWQRRLLRQVIAPLLGIAALLVVPPLLAVLAAVVWLLGGVLGL